MLSPLHPVIAKAKHKESNMAVRIFIFSYYHPLIKVCDTHSDDCNSANRVNTVDCNTYLHQFLILPFLWYS